MCRGSWQVEGGAGVGEVAGAPEAGAGQESTLLRATRTALQRAQQPTAAHSTTTRTGPTPGRPPTQSIQTAKAAAEVAGAVAAPARPCPSMGSRRAMATEPRCAPPTRLQTSMVAVSCRREPACPGCITWTTCGLHHWGRDVCHDPSDQPTWCAGASDKMHALRLLCSTVRGSEHDVLCRDGAAEGAEADGEAGEQRMPMAPMASAGM